MNLNLNVVLRHELHAMINNATADQLDFSLRSSESPIREKFVRFLALSFADWIATQNDTDDSVVKRDWAKALRLKNGTTPHKLDIVNTDKKLEIASPETSPDPVSSKYDGEKKVRQLKEKPLLDGFKTLTDRPNPFPVASPVRTFVKPDIDEPLLMREEKDVQVNGGTEETPSNNGLAISPVATPTMSNDEMKKHFEALPKSQQKLLKSKLPVLSEITAVERRNEVLTKKLTLCSIICRFNTTNPLELKAIEKKKQLLTEILEYIARYAWYNEQILDRCIQTISVNLFRSIPHEKKNPEVEDEPYEDPSWQHLQLIYDLTLRLVINTDVDKKTMKKYLEGKFVDNIIELFASEDPREREYLKTILHRIYGRFMPLRSLIRQSIANCCYRTIYAQTRNESGIAEFLEIFCSIIHGFSIPVKKEHKDFLRNVLVPLHKCRKLEKFHEQLVACCVQFVFKDPSIANVILGGLLKFWPTQSPTKEEMFIAEVVNVINAMINHKNGFVWAQNRDISLCVIHRLVMCMKSPHHSIAERALLVWGEDAIEILIDLDKKTIWPQIVEAFLDNKTHWNESLRECNEEAMDVFRVRDHELFTKIQTEYERKQSSNKIKTQSEMQRKVYERSQKWELIKKTADKNSKQVKMNGGTKH